MEKNLSPERPKECAPYYGIIKRLLKCGGGGIRAERHVLCGRCGQCEMIFQEYPSVCRPVDFSEEEMGGDGNEVSLSVIYI